MSTSPNGKTLGFEIPTPGTGRGSIKLHESDNGATHGCIGVSSDAWGEVKNHVSDSKCCGKTCVPFYVRYNGVAPNGNGNPTTPPRPLPPLPSLPEPDPGPDQKGRDVGDPNFGKP